MQGIVRLKRRFRATLAAAGFIVALVAGTALAPAAEAGGISYVWNSYSNSVSLYGVPAYASVIQWSRNGTKFQMYCWTDNAGQRWAWGQIFDTGRTLYVPMWEVGNQIGVRHC